MLDAGSGEVLTASRSPDFTRCDASAVTPPVAASTAWSRLVASPPASRPITVPMVGRMAVWTASHVESTYGILSATNSTA